MESLESVTGTSSPIHTNRQASAPWRLVQDEVHGAAWNMAVDKAILDAVGMGIAPPTLRLYRWDGPAISVGRFQDVERGVSLVACRALGVPIVRRPTGGRGILHDEDQTISLVVPSRDLGPAGASITASYGVLAQGFVCALAALGVALVSGTERRARADSGDCFTMRSHADLIGPDGSKLIGCAQRRSSGIILQQCSLRHHPPSVAPEQVFCGRSDPGIYPLDHVDEQALEKALISGFAEALGVQMVPGCLSGWEEERAALLCRGLRIDRVTAEGRESAG